MYEPFYRQPDRIQAQQGWPPDGNSEDETDRHNCYKQAQTGAPPRAPERRLDSRLAIRI